MSTSINHKECKCKALSMLSGKWIKCIIAVAIFVIITESASIIDTYLNYTYDNHAVKNETKNSSAISNITSGIVTNSISSSSASAPIISITSQDAKYRTPFKLECFKIAVSIFTIPMSVGYALYFLLLIQGKNPTLKDIFSGYDFFLNVLLTKLYTALRILLGFLLLIIPGFIAIFKYAMVDYIIAEDGNITYKEATEKSAYLMNGHKVDLFIVELSLIGWSFLTGIISFAISAVFVKLNMYAAAVILPFIPIIIFEAYSKATVASFYKILLEKNNQNNTSNYDYY